MNLDEVGAIRSERAMILAGPRRERPRDAIDVDVVSAAEPPPPGPGGRIIEAMGRPILERTHGGQRIGAPLALEAHGNPIAHGMNIASYLAWSGTHFLYPFSADETQWLFPVSCRP